MPEEQITNLEQTPQESISPQPLEKDIKENPLTEAKSPTPVVDTIVDIKQKEIEIKKKKRKFKLILIILITLIILSIAIPISINYYKRYFIQNKPIVQTVEEEDKKIKVEDINVEKKSQYNSDSLYISLEYLEKAKLSELVEGDNQIRKLEIIFEKQPSSDPNTLVTEDTLIEGYIFKVSTFTTTQRDLDQIVQVKKDAFTSKCPKTAIFTNIENTTIDGIEGRTFEVTNCGSDYKLTYLVKGTLNYEFAQIVKGDIGYKQVYRAETEDILNSVKFYPDKTEEGPLETFISTKYGFQFKHPKFNSECCDLTKPVSKDLERIVVLGDMSSFIDKDNFDGIGIFIENLYNEGGFNVYLDIQKKTLIDDYLVVRGQAPKLEEKTLKIGNKDGIMLKGYSWRGEDLIYLNLYSDNNHSIIMVISIKNISGREFEKKVDEILKSFEYFTPSQ